MQNFINLRSGTLLVVILLAAFSRLLPHIDNVTPIAAMCLFGGAYFSDKRFAFLVPLVAMFLSDVVISFVAGYEFFSVMRLYIYGAFAVITIIGLQLRDRVNVPKTILASLLGSVLFFAVSNFAVWAIGGGIKFPLTGAGLIACYEFGIPFFRYTIGGDLLFVAILFGGFELAKAKFPALAKVEA